jgi:3-phosphoshikimate 1-carboxyvinyltransferase
VLDCGNSGTTMRLLLGILAGHDGLFAVLDGDASLRRRPMGRVLEPLARMGAQTLGRHNGSLAPLALRGARLRAIEHRSPVASAQLKSALLLAGIQADGVTRVVEPSASRDHTERLLAAMGAPTRVDGTTVEVEGPLEGLRPVSMRVPGDVSSAAFWLVLACIHPDARLVVRGVGVNPTRTGLLDVLREMGARIALEHPRQEGGEPVADLVAESSELRGCEVGGAIIPRLIDEIPVLAVAAAFARGETRVRDAAELRHKESDRLATTARELTLLGADVAEQPDGLTVRGRRPLRFAEAFSHGDHRLAMALAVAAAAGDGAAIADAAAASVSYPAFWDDLRAVGAAVSLA